MAILYDNSIYKSNSKYGFTLFHQYTLKEVATKLTQPFDASVFLGLVRSIQGYTYDNRIFAVGVKEPHHKNKQGVIATYTYNYAYGIAKVRQCFKTNASLDASLCLFPQNVFAIEYSGVKTDTELFDLVLDYFRRLEAKSQSSQYLTCALFSKDSKDWHIVKKTDTGTKQIKASDYLESFLREDMHWRGDVMCKQIGSNTAQSIVQDF